MMDTSPGQRPDPMNVLIVDDEPGTRLAVATAVERLGHRASQAADGEAGWRRFEADGPDVLVTDWAMPGLDGTELAGRVRRSTRTPYTYVLVLTGRADAEAKRDAVQAGADDVLQKPLDAGELDRKLIAAERVIAVHERLHEDAHVDALTGVGSRRRLFEDLAAMCARVDRYGHNYCVALVGLDRTDERLVRAAGQALEAAIRSGDAVYHVGAAQFVALLPEQARDTANVAAERLRGAVEAALTDHHGAAASVSVGIAFTSTDCTPEELVAQAGDALARAMETPGGHIASQAEAGSTLRLMLADDDPVSRLTLSAIVKREVGFELVAEAEDAAQAIELALLRRPDVVLLDIDMRGGGGARAAVEIREALPDVRIVAISADDSGESQYDMMRAGAVGFITKGADGAEILRVIRSSARW